MSHPGQIGLKKKTMKYLHLQSKAGTIQADYIHYK